MLRLRGVSTMVIMNDIFFAVDTYIIKNGFCETDLDAKKQLIQEGLQKYLVGKVAEFDPTKTIPKQLESEVTVEELIDLLGEIIPKEDHEQKLSQITYYIKGMSGLLQGYHVAWWQENDESLITEPLIEFNSEGKWDSIKTHEKTPYTETAKFAYTVFKNNLFQKTPNKVLVYRKEQ